MKSHLAADALLDQSRWDRVPFRRIADPVTARNGLSDEPLLSVASSGLVSIRDGEGRQGTSDATITNSWVAQPGDLIVNPMWLIGGGIAVTDKRGAVSPDYRVYRFKRHIDPRFMHHLLRTPQYLAQYRLYTRADTTFDRRVSKDDFHSMPVPVPPLEEQRRIADFLDHQVARLDRAIALRQKQIEMLTERAISAARRATTLGLSEADTTITGVSWMPQMAARWQLHKLGTAFSTGSGTTPRSDNPAYYDGPYPWVNTSDLRDAHITDVPRSVTDAALADYSALKFYEPGTLLVAMYGATIGRLGLLDIRACVNQACCAVFAPTSVRTMYAFLWFFGHRSEIVELAAGGGQPNISQEVIRNLRIPAPPLAEQDTIIDTVEAQLGEGRRLEALFARQVALLQERKHALITAAVAGTFDVTTAQGAA